MPLSKQGLGVILPSHGQGERPGADEPGALLWTAM